MIDTRRQWLEELEQICPSIAAYNLRTTLLDFTYIEWPAEQRPIFHDADPYNMANSPPHNQIIAEAINALRQNARTSHPRFDW